MQQSRSFVYNAGPVAVARIPTFFILIAAALAVPAIAEEPLPPDEGGSVESMGQPPRIFPYAGLAAGAYRPSGDRIDPTGPLDPRRECS